MTSKSPSAPLPPGSPVAISWPHFLYGDPDLRKNVMGMNPDPQKHRFYMDVHPVRRKK